VRVAVSDIVVPSMGESMSEGTIAVVLKKPGACVLHCAARPFLEPVESLLTAPAGDAVSADEVIAQIETDKVTMDVRAPAAGVVDTIKVCSLPC
jgi:2-oxoglutarate dehydrogenase E2 component (dihydrolipoamide succinyltransferase)